MNLRLGGGVPLVPPCTCTWAVRGSTPSTSAVRVSSIRVSLQQNQNPKKIQSLLSKVVVVVCFGVFAHVNVSFPSSAIGIPFLNSPSNNNNNNNNNNSLQPQPQPQPTTPFSEAKNLPTGLLNGKIRPCPSVNPACVSTHPQSSNIAFPWTIPQNSTDDAIQKLQNAILSTQKNVKFQLVEDTPYGKYVQAEVDGGGFGGKDVFEFLIKGDMVAYRAMATKVTYIYPFTTAFGDSKGQEERMNKIIMELGWVSPTLEFNE
ncbi:hypothetical protein M9H77_04570 [Catharanthus roseus]|uniref:Uncharacterized protein n=1 Tax=Catharanthus roseus TaxID=4058 RepID=A0ACC0CEN6_CATRO|nr:hypothetical protein M9H77_04570 [Catharanthus roseus]